MTESSPCVRVECHHLAELEENTLTLTEMR